MTSKWWQSLCRGSSGGVLLARPAGNTRKLLLEGKEMRSAIQSANGQVCQKRDTCMVQGETTVETRGSTKKYRSCGAGEWFGNAPRSWVNDPALGWPGGRTRTVQESSLVRPITVHRPVCRA